MKYWEKYEKQKLIGNYKTMRNSIKILLFLTLMLPIIPYILTMKFPDFNYKKYHTKKITLNYKNDFEKWLINKAENSHTKDKPKCLDENWNIECIDKESVLHYTKLIDSYKYALSFKQNNDKADLIYSGSVLKIKNDWTYSTKDEFLYSVNLDLSYESRLGGSSTSKNVILDKNAEILKVVDWPILWWIH